MIMSYITLNARCLIYHTERGECAEPSHGFSTDDEVIAFSVALGIRRRPSKRVPIIPDLISL